MTGTLSWKLEWIELNVNLGAVAETVAREESIDPQCFEAVLKEHNVAAEALSQVLCERGLTPRVSISLPSLMQK